MDRNARRVPGWLFVATLGLSSALLFAVQPLAAKLLLPSLGGSAIVWAATSLFFQVVLLAGYALAHFSTARLGPRRQAVAVSVLVVLAILFVPAAPAEGAPLREAAMALPWVLLHLLVTVGPPALAFSVLAPSIQRWFAELPREQTGDPYRLYVASNVGSLLALLAYPLIIEPWLPLSAQRTAFRLGLGLLAIGVIGCATRLGPDLATTGSSRPRERGTWAQRGIWTGLAFVPASLSLAITTHITTDLAPVPLLWIAPLAVYLGTFIVAFTERGPGIARALWPLLPLVCVPMVPLLGLGIATPLAPVLAVHLLVLALVGLAFHGTLAQRRPAPAALTDFYLWLALGGAAGAAFNAVVAPLVLRRALELPTTLALALGVLILARSIVTPASEDDTSTSSTSHGALASVSLAVVVGTAMLLLRADDPVRGTSISFAPFAILAVPFALGHRWPRAAAVGVTVLLIGSVGAASLARPALHVERSLFSTYVVGESDRLELRYLAHGRTIHGVESLDPRLEGWALPYWPPESPAAQVLTAVAARDGSRAAVLGLGVGALSVFADPDGEMVFYELDPAMGRIAHDYFGYLDRCGNACRVVIDDGRAGMEADDTVYDLIVLDAFSSSAIPVHLLTREALQIYLDHLTPDGVILVHVTNHYVDLHGPLAAAADTLELEGRARDFEPDRSRMPEHTFVAGSRWVALARTSPALAVAEASGEGWGPLHPRRASRVWTDDYANPLATYRW